MKKIVFLLCVILSTNVFAFEKETKLVSQGTVDLDQDGRTDTIRIFYIQTKPSTEKGFKKYDQVIVQADYGHERYATVDHFYNTSDTPYKIITIEDFQNDLDFDVQIGKTTTATRTYLNEQFGKLALTKDRYHWTITPMLQADIYLKALNSISISNPSKITLLPGMNMGEGVVVSTARADLNNDGEVDLIEVRYSRTLPLAHGQKIQSLADLNEVSVIARVSTRDAEANEDYLRSIVIDKFENKASTPFLITGINDARKDMAFDIGIHREPDASIGETRETDANFDRYNILYENSGRATFTKSHDVYIIKITPEQTARWYKQTYDTITIKHAGNLPAVAPSFNGTADEVTIKKPYVRDTLPPIMQPDIE